MQIQGFFGMRFLAPMVSKFPKVKTLAIHPHIRYNCERMKGLRFFDLPQYVANLLFALGSYYLCDNGYANSEGFLTPFKGVRYHLKEWGPANQRPNSPKEMFNMRHTMARNVIERAFAILKMRWSILRSASFYPIETQTRLIMCCFLLHNYVRGEMGVDPVEAELDDIGDEGDGDATGTQVEAPASEVQFVDTIEASPGWNQKRVDMANYMWANQ